MTENENAMIEMREGTKSSGSGSLMEILHGVLDKLGAIAHAKKDTGSFYYNGKNYYFSKGDACCSFMVIIALLATFFLYLSQLGKIDNV
jgi:hypothetical protein